MASTSQDQHEFASVDDLAPIALMDGIRVRAVDGERITLAVFELEPGMRMPGIDTRMNRSASCCAASSPSTSAVRRG